MEQKPMTPEMFLSKSIENFVRGILKMSGELSEKDFQRVWQKAIKQLSKEERKSLSSITHLLLKELSPEEVS